MDTSSPGSVSLLIHKFEDLGPNLTREYAAAVLRFNMDTFLSRNTDYDKILQNIDYDKLLQKNKILQIDEANRETSKAQEVASTFDSADRNRTTRDGSEEAENVPEMKHNDLSSRSVQGIESTCTWQQRVRLQHRLHLWEWHDLDWVPKTLRDLLTESLQFFWCSFPGVRFLSVAAKLVPIVRATLVRAQSTEIVDMCSGSGGPHPVIAEALAGEGVHVTLTDLYPRVQEWQRLQSLTPALRHVPISVDATRVPKGVIPRSCLRTFNGCFHHFAPDLAQSLLQNCIDHRHSVMIVEATPRLWLSLIMMSVAQLVAVVAFAVWIGWGSPLLKQRLVFTFLLPIYPLMHFWDCTVSHLRCYTEAELRYMARDLCRDGESYTWTFTALSPPLQPMFKMYAFTGIPKELLT